MSPDGFPGMPPDPVGETLGFAIHMHETFESFTTAGFTDDQAMQFCMALLGVAAMRSNPEA